MERITAKEARERTNKVNTDEAVLELALTQIYKEIKDATEPKCGNSFVTLDFGKKFRHHKIWRKIKEELERDGYTVEYNDVAWKMTIKW
jgi:site-specific DNA-cytosine methylase